MATARAFVISVVVILLISFVLAATASVGGARKIQNHHRETNRTDTATSHSKTERRRAPVADRQDTKLDAPLEVVTPHPHHLFKDEYKRKVIAAKHPHPNKVHKQIHHHNQSGHIQQVDLPGSKKTKSKVSVRRMRRVLKQLTDEPVKIAHKTETDTIPLEIVKPHRHALKEKPDIDVSILKTPASKKEHKHSRRQAKRGRIAHAKREPDTTPLVMMKPYHQVTSTDKNVSSLNTPESKKEHKHAHRQVKRGRVQNVDPLAANTTLAKEPKPSHKKSRHVSGAGDKKLARGKWRHVTFEERPLCKPRDSETTTTRPAPKHQSKTKRIVDSYHKTPASGLRDVLVFPGPGRSGQNQKKPDHERNLDNKAARLLDSFPGPSTNSNGFPDIWAMNRFVVNKAHSAVPKNKVERCADCTKKVDLLTEKGAKEVAGGQCAGSEGGGSTSMDQSVEDAPEKIRVRKSVGSAMKRENLTVDWSDDTDAVKATEDVDDDSLRHCIPTQTFAVGLICMSVVLSICFLFLWRKTDQPERMYALAYIVACIVYVILALVYLGTKSADYIHAEE